MHLVTGWWFEDSPLHSQFCPGMRVLWFHDPFRQPSESFQCSTSSQTDLAPGHKFLPPPLCHHICMVLQWAGYGELKWAKNIHFFLTDQKSKSAEWERKAMLSHKWSKRGCVGTLTFPIKLDHIVNLNSLATWGSVKLTPPSFSS